MNLVITFHALAEINYGKGVDSYKNIIYHIFMIIFKAL